MRLHCKVAVQGGSASNKRGRKQWKITVEDGGGDFMEGGNNGREFSWGEPSTKREMWRHEIVPGGGGDFAGRH